MFVILQKGFFGSDSNIALSFPLSKDAFIIYIGKKSEKQRQSFVQVVKIALI